MQKQTFFDNETCAGSITFLSHNTLQIKGTLKSLVPNAILYYWAASPPTYGISYSGSGLPYPNPIVAYDRTPNKGVININNSEFNFNIKYPNAYYIGLGSLYIPPHINFKISTPNNPDKYLSIKIDEGIPFKMLTYPAPPGNKPRISPLFYSEPEKQARTQEAILRSGSNFNAMPDNFWGEKPPR